MRPLVPGRAPSRVGVPAPRGAMVEFFQKTGTAQAAEALSGTILGRFAVRERLGKGGMGEVYRAEDTKLRRSVALKRITPHLRSDPVYRQRFLKEAERASCFADPHVAAIYDVLEENGEIYLIMEYVEGETLRQRLHDTFTFEQFLDIALQCTQAVASAHEHGILHCDIKPENIMLTSAGQVKILDFGVAKHLPRSDESSTLDKTRTLGGTPAYMAPEVLLESPFDGRADVFSLGVVFYEALTGQQPFQASSFVATTEKVLREDPPPLRVFNPKIPGEMQSLVTQMLAKKRSDRLASARELESRLKRLQQLQTTTMFMPVTQGGFRRRWWKPIGIVALALILVVVGAAVWPRAIGWLRPSPRFAERGWVLISDFDVDDGSTLPDAGVREGLAIALQQSKYLNVYPRSRVYQVLQRMKRDNVTHIDEALGREICQRENVPVLLAGSIVRSGNAFQIMVRAVEPTRGDLLFGEKTEFERREDFFRKIDWLAGRVRKDLGEPRTAIENARPLAKVTTSSLEALQLYSKAIDARARGDLDQLPTLLQGALNLDSNFAMAHFLMADVYESLGDRTKELEHLSKAYLLRKEITDRERSSIESSYYDVMGQEDKAVQALTALVTLYPDDPEARRQLASEYFNVGDLAHSIQELRQAIKADPNFSPSYGNLILFLARSNAADEAIQAYREAQAHGRDSPTASWGLGMALWNQGKIAEAQVQFQRLQETDPSYESVGRIYFARTLIYQGQLAAAEERILAGIHQDEAAKRKSPELLQRYLLAQIALIQGNKVEAHRQLKLILAAGEPEAYPTADLRRAGALSAKMGDLGSARLALRRLAQLQAKLPNSFIKACRDNLAGEIALAAGQTGEAVRLFSASLAEYPLAISHHGLARAYEKQRNWSGAAREWEGLLQARGEIFQDNCPTDWVLAHLSLARLYRHTNQIGPSRAAYEKFLDIWKAGDRLPLVEEAVRESQELSRP